MHNPFPPQTQLSAVIVEDLEDSLNQLKGLLNTFPQVRVIGEASDGEHAIRLVQDLRPDLLFLDIHLPGMDGFEILERLSHHPVVVFTTAHHGYALKAFDANGVDYLLKPIDRGRLEKALHKVFQMNAGTGGAVPYNHIMEAVKAVMAEKTKKIRFSIQAGDRLLVVSQEEVFYFKAEDRYLFLCTFDDSFFYKSSLKELEESLDPDAYIRINKSIIISIDKILCLKRDYLGRFCVVLKDKKQTVLKVSRGRLADLREKFDNFRCP